MTAPPGNVKRKIEAIMTAGGESRSLFFKSFLFAISIGYGGIIYDSIYGGISIENYSPLKFSSYLNSNPDGGGPLTMIGNNARMQL